MMGRLNQDQGQLFYSFNLEEAVPTDHQVREIASVLDLSWLHGELAPHYAHTGRPSIDPALIIRGSRGHAMRGSVTATFCATCLNALSAHASPPGLLAAKDLQWMRV